MQNLLRDALIILLIAQIFAFLEMWILPGAYALFRFRKSENFISEMGLILHSLNSTSTWLNFVMFSLAGMIIFLLVILLGNFLLKRGTRNGIRDSGFGIRLIGSGGLLFFSFMVFFLNALSSPVSSFRKILFELVLGAAFILWLASGWFWRKNAREVFLILLSAIIFALVNLARAILILYKIQLGFFGISLLVVSAILLLSFCLGLGLKIDQSPSRLIQRLKSIFSLAILGFGIWIISLPGLSWMKWYCPRPRGSKSPNVIMIVLDTARADHLSVYGYSRETTPFLKELAQASLVFERAYSTSPWTLPSHASFFTGLMPSEHNCTYENLRLADKFTTLAEILKKDGYFTLGWSNNPLLNYASGLVQGFDRFVENNQLPLYTGEILRRAWLNRFPDLVADNGAKLTNQTLSRWLQRIRTGRRSFFLFLNYMEAHTPYTRAPLAYKFFTDPEHARKNYASPNWDMYNCEHQQDQKIKNTAIKWYDGSILYLDTELRKVFEMLQAKGLLENSIIVILSDHGESFGEHNWWGHGVNLYNTDLWVPLLIYYPKLLAPRRIQENFSLKDLPGLILKLVEGRSENEIIGQISNPKPVFAEVFTPLMYLERMAQACPQGDFSWLNRREKALVQGANKLIWNSKFGWELYQIADDPEEINNLTHQSPEVFPDLQARMQAFLAEHPYSPGTGRIDSRTINALKSLGYLK